MAWIVAIGLGIAVVVLGLRRNLGETTRNWLPRSEGATEQETGALGYPAMDKGVARSPYGKGDGCPGDFYYWVSPTQLWRFCGPTTG
jgi:hypothetical protein